MHAEIVAIGTELTSGEKLDTNSQWLSVELAGLGIPVRYHTTVADDLEAMLGVLRDAVNRSDVVLISGGLGPTLDDLTRQALADLTQTSLVLDEASLETIRSFFTRHRREMPERNRIQAMFPENAEAIPNPRGTAPGIWMTVSRKGNDTPCIVAAMPGVPSEMRPMFRDSIAPRLPSTGMVIRRARINTFGVGESKAEEMLGDLTARGRDPEIGITAHEATITLRIAAHGRSVDECASKIEAARSAIRQKMGRLVFGEEDDELEHIVVQLLNERGLTLSTVESGSNGVLAQRLAAVAGADSCLRGSLVAPSAEALTTVLSLDSADLFVRDRFGEESAIALADGCRARFQTDFALSIADMPLHDATNP
ncbi:MAG: CinA family nicotinamide mononucleotide deamidase-related protein, partial [Planctomycetaceae bacterium]